MKLPSPPLAGAAPDIDNCWSRIGVTGDRSCSKLKNHLHCRNCPVYSAAATQLLDRDLPDQYVQERTQSFSERKRRHDTASESVIIFRIASEWLALPASCAVEVAELRPIHSLPSRVAEVVLGLINVHGELLVCISLAHLLALPASRDARACAPGNFPRLLVIQGEGGRLAIPVDEMHGLYRFDTTQLHDTPFTVAHAQGSFTTALLPWQGHMVGCLDAQLITYTVNRSLA